MTFWILVALGLYVFQTLLPPLFRYVLRSDPRILATVGARDDPPETSVYGAPSRDRQTTGPRSMEQVAIRGGGHQLQDDRAGPLCEVVLKFRCGTA